jgi:sterol desaturase/sphingolipid hydroxylase (fatty acid hydroxylase superfamily)
MYLYENVIIPLYGSWLYCVTSYYDYYMNKDLYLTYPNLIDKIDVLFINIFFWLPFSLFCITTIQPVNVFFNSFQIEIMHIIINYILGDVWFYTLHRICHQPKLYFLHKQHHEVINTIGILSLYAHPFDAIIINLGSMMTLHLILQFSFFQIMFIGGIATISTIITSHTGRGIYSHQLHHLYRNCNYGIGLFMDKLLLTYRE